MIRLEPRLQPSRALAFLAPVAAVVVTALAGLILFWILGKDPARALYLFFLAPLLDAWSLSEIAVKAIPLVLIATGLAFGFRAGVWNIGAEGQYTIGALAGGATALAFYDITGVWLLPLMALAGMLGGMAYASIAAVLKTRLNANEILVTLMLTYVATLFLSILVHGPLRDPDGFNFPESRLFHDAATLPILIEDTRVHIGLAVMLVVVIGAWLAHKRHVIGFAAKVTGQAPRAARFAGFLEKRMIWSALLLSGGLAGLAGMLEVAGPLGQLTPAVPVGYGFTAIIVAFLGRLHPIGVLLAGFVMALTYIGGETAQIEMNLPNAVTGVFQGMFLFALLSLDVLARYRIRAARPAAGRT